MSTAREPDQADFDLERFIEMFDTAMTSDDPRVVETLRKLMMIVALTRPEADKFQGRSSGPLRRLFEDMHHLNSRMVKMNEEIHELRRTANRSRWEQAEEAKVWPQAAAVKMAQEIDQDIMSKIANKVNRPVANLGPENRAKGLLEK